MTESYNFSKILKTLNILYIEDERNIRLNIKKTLELFCENVFDAENILIAKEILNSQRIDIIISDINLPDMSGIEFVKEIRITDKTIPIILLSAYTDKEFLLEATRLKLVDYLIKPINFQSLNNALQNCIKEILDNSRYVITFENNIQYNVLQRKLINLVNQSELSLTSKELDLLDFLIKNSCRVCSSEELKNTMWENFSEATDSALKNLLNKIRKKIGKESITNISGVGYRINY
jgi:two-component system, OmpR family, response regulator VanR